LLHVCESIVVSAVKPDVFDLAAAAVATEKPGGKGQPVLTYTAAADMGADMVVREPERQQH